MALPYIKGSKEKVSLTDFILDKFKVGLIPQVSEGNK